MKTIMCIVGGIMLIMAGTIGFFIGQNQAPVNDLGSVNYANEYHANRSIAAGHDLVQTGATTLGSVVILKDSAQTITIWNATSTKDTASTTFGVIEASAADGTYTFDAVLTRGLVIEPAASYAGEIITTYR